MEEKIKELARIIVNYSLNVTEDEKVLITYQSSECNLFVKELIKELTRTGAIPFVNRIEPEINILLKEKTTSKRIDLMKEYQQFELDHFDSFINIKYNENEFDSKNIKENINKEIQEKTYAIHNKMVNERKWVLLNYPSLIDSYKAQMTREEYFQYAMDVMTLDYNRMNEDVKPLKELMEKTKKVRITGPNTDLTFSIEKMPIVPCVGKANIPDGEVYTAPIKTSVEGKITYNTTSIHDGEKYENISLEFHKGKIVNASCSEKSKNEKLNKIFDLDKGSRYVGEFSFGINPKILKPMGDILFDEKIIGSIHFTPGAAYQDCYNGNDSSLHWDLVLIQRKEYGGGSIYFDDVLIRQDGLFVLDELKHLNYQLDK